jgi:hypothetical protein
MTSCNKIAGTVNSVLPQQRERRGPGESRLREKLAA